MKKHLEYKDEKSHKFWQIEVVENAFTVTYGKVGTNGQSKTKEFDNAEKANQEAEKVIKQKLKKGYKNPNKSNVLTTKDLLKYKKVNFSELNENIYHNLQGNHYKTAILITEDIVIDDLNLDLLHGKTDALIIDANLSVAEGIVNFCGDYGIALIVTGNVEADFIIAGGSEIYLEGKTIIHSIVYGFYNHGILNISDIRVPIVITDDHHNEVYGNINKDYNVSDDADEFAEKFKIKPDFIVQEQEDQEDDEEAIYYYYINSDKLTMYIDNKKNRSKLCKQLLN